MAGSIKPTRGTRRRGAALLALAAALLSAPVAWALGELSRKPGTAGCVSENGTGGLCQNGKALENATGVGDQPRWQKCLRRIGLVRCGGGVRPRARDRGPDPEARHRRLPLGGRHGRGSARTGPRSTAPPR